MFSARGLQGCLAHQGLSLPRRMGQFEFKISSPSDIAFGSPNHQQERRWTITYFLVRNEVPFVFFWEKIYERYNVKYRDLQKQVFRFEDQIQGHLLGSRSTRKCSNFCYEKWKMNWWSCLLLPHVVKFSPNRPKFETLKVKQKGSIPTLGPFESFWHVAWYLFILSMVQEFFHGSCLACRCSLAWW